MTDPTQDLLPVGLEDRLPKSAAAATRIEAALLGPMHGHGYDRVMPPLVEFEKSMAARMDGLRTRDMFRFVDPSSLKTLALRSDMTAQIGRMAATSLAQNPRPLRLCYAGQVARIVGEMLDPRRECLQVGAELIGSDTAASVAEAVELAITALESAGATGISVDFTLPDLVDRLASSGKGAFALSDEQCDGVRAELDAKDAAGLIAAGGEAYVPLLYAAGPFAEALEKLSEFDVGGILDSRIEGLREIASRIDGRARVTLDPTDRHGFEYQSWFGFTIYADGIRGALGRGGTYIIGGSDEVATGFSLYPEDLVEAVKGDEDLGKTLFLPIGHDRDAAALLRAEGWRTIAALSAADNAKTLGCSAILDGDQAKAL